MKFQPVPLPAIPLFERIEYILFLDPEIFCTISVRGLLQAAPPTGWPACFLSIFAGRPWLCLVCGAKI